MVNVTDPAADKVVAIPQAVLMRRKPVQRPDLPFTVHIKHFFANSVVNNRPTNSTDPPAATQGIGPRATVKDLPRVTEMDKRDVPSAVVEIVTPQGSLGTWLVSEVH